MFLIDLGVQSDYSVLGVSPQASVNEIRASVDRIFGDLDRQRKRARTEAEKTKISEKQVNLNRIGGKLSNPVERAKYDLINAHLTFFLIRSATSPMWEERDLMLRWVHEAVRKFLAERGESFEGISDLERSDFTADFTANDRLEQLLRQKAGERP